MTTKTGNKANPVAAKDLAIKAIKPHASRHERPVKDHKGLVVIIWPDGRKAWSYRGRIDGTLYRQHLGMYPEMSLVEALAKFGELRAERKKGVDLAAHSQRAKQHALASPTVKALCADYIVRHAKPNKRTWRQDERMLEKDVLPEWGRMKAEGITDVDVVALLDRITDRGSPMQAGKVLALVRKVWNFGIGRRVLAVNPAKGIPRPAKVRANKRHLTDPELRYVMLKLAKADIRPQVAAAIQLQLWTGQRIGECLQAEWSEINTDEMTWLIPASKAKNKTEHLVPLSDEALAVIEAQPRVSNFVFPATRGDAAIRSEVAAHELAEVLATGEVAKFTTHDLRRTVATRLVSLKVSKEIRDRVLNHKDSSVGAVHYDQHDHLDEKREALEKWAELLAEVLEGKRKDNVLPMRRRRA